MRRFSAVAVLLLSASLGAVLAAQSAAPTTTGITLVSPGAEPRALLRYHPVAGAKNRAAMVMDMRMTMDVGGMAAPAMNMPRITSDVEMGVTAVNADGDITFSTRSTNMKIDTTNTDPVLAAAMQGALPATGGVAAGGVMSSRGEPRDVKLDAASMSAEAQAFVGQFQDAMRQVQAGLPAEPVGVGAQWDVVSTVTQSGSEMIGKMRFELVAIDGDVVTLKARGTIGAGKGGPALPGLPPGADVDVRDMSGDVNGNMRVNLRTMETSADLKTEMRISADLKMQGQTMPFSTKISMQMTLGPVK